MGQKVFDRALGIGNVLNVLLHLLDLLLEGGDIKLFKRAAEAYKLLDLRIIERDLVLFGDLLYLLTQLVIGHILGLVEDELELIDDGGGVGAAYFICKLGGNGELLGADKLCVLVKLLAGNVLISHVYADEGSRAGDLVGCNDFYIGIGDAGGDHGIHVHVGGAPCDVFDRDIKPLAAALRLNVDAGYRPCADEAFVDLTFKVLALVCVCNGKLLYIASLDAEGLVHGRYLVAVEICAYDRAAVGYVVGMADAAA